MGNHDAEPPLGAGLPYAGNAVQLMEYIHTPTHFGSMCTHTVHVPDGMDAMMLLYLSARKHRDGWYFAPPLPLNTGFGRYPFCGTCFSLTKPCDLLVGTCVRVDAAVRCFASGQYDMVIESTTAPGVTTPLAVLDVEDGTGGQDEALGTWEPCR